MDDKRFEDIIQSKLADYEANIPINKIWESIEKELPRKKVVPIRHILWSSAAAIVAGIIGISVFIWAPDPLSHPQDKNTVSLLVQPENKNEIVPSRETTETEKIILTNHPTPVQLHKALAVKTEKIVDAEKTVVTVNEAPVVITRTEIEAVEKPVNREDKNTLVTKEEYEQKLRDFENAGKVLPELEKQSKKSSSSGFSLNLLASNTIPGSSTNHNNDNFKNIPTLSTAPILKYTHRMPISAGITVEKTFAKNWGIETGLVYSYLHSDYKTEDMSQKGKQELHYLGIPVNINYRFARVGIVTFYTSAGAKADFNISGSHKDIIKNNQLEGEDFERFTDNKTQFSVNLKLGASLTFYKMFSVYAEPTMGYYFDNGSEIKNIWKEKPLNFGINLGLRSSF